MKIAVDFDGTIVLQDKPYAQIDGQFNFVLGAKEALASLKAAGHILLLWSARSSLHHRFDVALDPLHHVRPWTPRPGFYETNELRFQEMCEFVGRELPGIFDAIDDGRTGKPTVDLFLDDRALRVAGTGLAWSEIAEMHGA